MRRKSFRTCLSFAALLATGCAEPPPQLSTCDPPLQLSATESLLGEDPFAAIAAVNLISDCDDKFALMYAAEAHIAARAQEDYYYQGEVRPRGWYDAEPSAFTAYVLTHVNRFESAEETAHIRANSFWLDQIQNRNHPALGSAELEAIRQFDQSVWEDGDGFRHNEGLVARYRSWLARWPEHSKVAEVLGRISELAEPATVARPGLKRKQE